MSAESIKLGLRQDRAAIVRQLRERIRRMEHDYARPPQRRWIGTGLVVAHSAAAEWGTRAPIRRRCEVSPPPLEGMGHPAEWGTRVDGPAAPDRATQESVTQDSVTHARRGDASEERRVVFDGAQTKKPALHAREGSSTRAFDERLAGGGLPTGSVVELIGSGRACGGLALATWLTARAAADGGQAVVIDSAGDFYPPAAEQLGLGADRMVLVHPRREVDALWAAEQSLRSPTVAAVLVTCLWRVEHRQSRRLQLAAEAGGGIGLLVRPVKAQARGRVSTAAVRLLVGPTRSEPGRVRWLVQVLRCRGGWPSEPVVVGLEDEARDVPVHAAAVGGADEPVLRLAGG